jgi:hypothetical protein
MTEKKKRLGFQDDFELLMVRHEYISKVKNPDPAWVKKWEPIVNTTAMLMYNKLKPNFAKVGYELDDVVSITNCYMIGYMGLYSLERNEKARTKIVDSFNSRLQRDPTDAELLRKERTNLISFLRQRLQHASVLCSRKARSITVGNDKRAIYAFTKDSVPASQELIYEKGKSLGYRKVTKNELKEIKLDARINRTKELKDKFGFPIIQVELLNDGITEYDYRGLFISDQEDFYHKNPEEAILIEEKNRDLSLIMKEYGDLDEGEKKNTLKKFISVYKGNKKYKEEIVTARQMLKVM